MDKNKTLLSDARKASEVAADGDAVRQAIAAAAPDAGGACLWRELGRVGVLDRLYVSGGEPNRRVLETLLATLDAHQLPGMVLSICVQAASAVPLLCALAGGRAEARAARVGEVVVALAATDEAVAGSALLDSQTRVDADGNEVVLNGGKDWITNAGSCDVALVLARRRPARHFTSFAWVLVPAGHPGVYVEPAVTRYFAGAAVGHLRFDGVRLPATHMIGRPGRALAEFARHVASERLAGALWARALCRRVLLETQQYLRSRSAGETTLWENAAIRERFARCLVEWRRLDAVCAVQSGPAPDATSGMVLKAAYADSADRILGECAALHGAEAFRSGGLADLRAEVAMFGVAGGATGALLAQVADRAGEVMGDGM